MRVRVVLAAMAMAAVFAGAAEAAPRYTALGDSYAAGPLIPAPVAAVRLPKSSNNYGRLAQRTLAFTIPRRDLLGRRDRGHDAPQGVSPRPNPPQFDRCRRHTTLVTITIGGNDIGFSAIAEDCFSGTTPAPRARTASSASGDEISQRIAETAPKVDAVLDGIRTRLAGRADPGRQLRGDPPPHAATGCWPRADLDGDVPYVRAKQEELNQMLAEQARPNGAQLVDVYGASQGRSACAGSGTRWVEPTSPATRRRPCTPTCAGCRRWPPWLPIASCR